MNGKIYTTLIVLFCIAQGLNARSTHEIAPRISDEEFIQTLNELINKIHKSVENIEEVIQHLEEKIQEDLDTINLPQIIAQLENKIEEITDKLQTSSVDIVRCLLAQQPALRELEYIANKGVEICLSEADQTKNEIRKNFVEISVKAASSISNVTGGILNCFNNSADKINNCLGSLVEPSVEEVNSLLVEIYSTIQDSQHLVQKVDKNLSECVTQVQKEIVNKENEIVHNFEKCVKA